MIKSFHGFTSFVLGLGLVASNFYTLNLLARKDSGIPNLAALPSNKYSSFSIRSEKDGDKHSWTMASNQHDPKKLLYTKDEIRPGFKGKTQTYIHKETVALTRPSYSPEVQDAIDMACLETGIKGEANGEIIGSGIGAATSPAIMQVPIIGPVASGIWFGLARKQSGKVGSKIARDWNDC